MKGNYVCKSPLYSKISKLCAFDGVIAIRHNPRSAGVHSEMASAFDGV